MEALQAELARKRKEREESQAASGQKGRKWVKRGDLEKQRVEQYHATEAAEAAERVKKELTPHERMERALAAEAAAKKAAADGAAGKTAGGAAAAAGESSSASFSAMPASSGLYVEAVTAKAAGSGDAKDFENLSKADVMRRLRALGQPIRLFAETEEERLDRYRAVSSALPTESEVDLQLKAGQMFDETQLWDDAGAEKQEAARLVGTQEDAFKDDEDDADADEAAPSFVATTPEQTVARHFKQLLKLWEEELEAREPAEVAAPDGRVATAAFQQCKRHLRPFFKLLRTRSLPLDILSTMVEITTFMQQREYVKAHDAYIKCAIGTAPWPMGITGTGIHERQGRQHVRESKIANVMNDETQRKYLQSVKRLMTFGQRAMPPTGPSKAVR